MKELFRCLGSLALLFLVSACSMHAASDTIAGAYGPCNKGESCEVSFKKGPPAPAKGSGAFIGARSLSETKPAPVAPVPAKTVSTSAPAKSGTDALTSGHVIDQRGVPDTPKVTDKPEGTVGGTVVNKAPAPAKPAPKPAKKPPAPQETKKDVGPPTPLSPETKKPEGIIN